MKKYLDIEKWDRKDHFFFFKGFSEPFFGLTTDIDCTEAYTKARKMEVSFFLYYLHKLLVAANSIEAFRYRIEDDKVAIYEQINISPTIPRDNGTFGFSQINYHPEFENFYVEAYKEVERVKQEKTLVPGNHQNVIHFSAIPWVRFTSVSHARHFDVADSIPKISSGKLCDEQGKKIMPLSVHVNHALMDGSHVGEFFDTFQNLMA